MNFLDPATPEQISEFERKNFQFYSYVLEMTLQIFLKHLQVPSL